MMRERWPACQERECVREEFAEAGEVGSGARLPELDKGKDARPRNAMKVRLRMGAHCWRDRRTDRNRRLQRTIARGG
ncbi:MAG: hypothetical protein IT547_17705 [Hyphomonadaceae bacterium]|nr:hypothetical protein [Hyphomonadaceae bacterium]